jgi:hypothetical protein
MSEKSWIENLRVAAEALKLLNTLLEDPQLKKAFIQSVKKQARDQIKNEKKLPKPDTAGT